MSQEITILIPDTERIVKVGRLYRLLSLADFRPCYVCSNGESGFTLLARLEQYSTPREVRGFTIPSFVKCFQQSRSVSTRSTKSLVARFLALRHTGEGQKSSVVRRARVPRVSAWLPTVGLAALWMVLAAWGDYLGSRHISYWLVPSRLATTLYSC
ncbi:hypothetical protein RRG08_042456 [Elysia crispata]|uniref:Uncharacterized protein n=1 Tax=Elysia crispata TaxID=231223 RepID=A0AAE1DEP1_9GAST|nr:hypothetical protein RRG08_042456 [Elysia crispata]